MRCEEFESRINELLDERRQPHADERVADHVRYCDAGADVVASSQEAVDVVRGGGPVATDTDRPPGRGKCGGSRCGQELTSQRPQRGSGRSRCRRPAT